MVLGSSCARARKFRCSTGSAATWSATTTDDGWRLGDLDERRLGDHVQRFGHGGDAELEVDRQLGPDRQHDFALEGGEAAEALP